MNGIKVFMISFIATMIVFISVYFIGVVMYKAETTIGTKDIVIYRVEDTKQSLNVSILGKELEFRKWEIFI